MLYTSWQSQRSTSTTVEDLKFLVAGPQACRSRKGEAILTMQALTSNDMYPYVVGSAWLKYHSHFLYFCPDDEWSIQSRICKSFPAWSRFHYAGGNLEANEVRYSKSNNIPLLWYMVAGSVAWFTLLKFEVLFTSFEIREWVNFHIKKAGFKLNTGSWS